MQNRLRNRSRRTGLMPAIAVAGIVAAMVAVPALAAGPGSPTVSATNPASPASANNLVVTGTAPAGTTVQLYTDDGDGGTSCDTAIGSPASESTFSSSGIA